MYVDKKYKRRYNTEGIAMRNLGKYFLYLPFISVIILSCISPTFDSPIVKKGSSGWIGATAGINSFDYSIPDDYSMEDTRGVIGGFGFNYGFTENVGLTTGLLLYAITGQYDGIVPKREYIPSLYLAPKFELTRNNSRVAFSFALGPAHPELIKTELMVGFRGLKNEILTFGTHLTFYVPYDFFINLGPAQGPGFVFYLGYQIPYFNNPLNLAAGIGYRL
ncbi:MAG: hypothetical protein ACUVQT_01610 [bacterium]